MFAYADMDLDLVRLFVELVYGSGDGDPSDTTLHDRLGNTSHLGINTTYSNPGVLAMSIGVRVSPLKGHEITGWYVNRHVANSALLDQAFLVGVDPGFKAIFTSHCTTNLEGLAADPQCLF